MLRKTLLGALGALIIATGCTPTKVVVPLEEGQWQIGVTQGRPQIKKGIYQSLVPMRQKEFPQLKQIMEVFNFPACF